MEQQQQQNQTKSKTEKQKNKGGRTRSCFNEKLCFACQGTNFL